MWHGQPLVARQNSKVEIKIDEIVYYAVHTKYCGCTIHTCGQEVGMIVQLKMWINRRILPGQQIKHRVSKRGRTLWVVVSGEGATFAGPIVPSVLTFILFANYAVLFWSRKLAFCSHTCKFCAHTILISWPQMRILWKQMRIFSHKFGFSAHIPISSPQCTIFWGTN